MAAPKKKQHAAQKFVSTKPALRLVTEKGKLIKFINYSFVTSVPSEADYLKEQIDEGLNLISFEGAVTADDLDPMAGFRAKVEAEVRASIAKEQDGAATPSPIIPVAPLGAASSKTSVL